MTQPKTHHTRAQLVKATWGRRCNKLLFMSTVYDKSIPTVKLLVNEGRDYLWAKTKEGFRYVYEQHRSEADWFLKADDDSYVVVENLRYLLHNYSSRDPLYFGCRFKPYVKQGYMAGGAGYVLSREALNLFVNKGLSSTDKCAAVDFGPEDVLMGKCMELIGVKAMDSRDTFGRGRFFPFRPVAHLFPLYEKDFWYWSYLYYQAREGLDCCSDFAISFHYINCKQMYVLDYLIYHLHPFGINYKDEL
ncbi:glycoprotein-N-acetylgalactosamine 3-beta-galactosyltransferase 1-like [Achroia grisella]|uniref:glycoprotein-N-acetylgalactosamine 3-beta-galactosyltransferase 1-like n=1 Tax=Achroia grisella TaxID=688607 RepID=UPI0027D23058|nr:glycoprotein-N-acetylgalactosamine 3-beta-galactosyltransferase 1-like [Achroia grisella]